MSEIHSPHEPQDAPAGEEPHDVLAAEEFAMPGADPELHHGPVSPPEDPSGIVEPHDVLAAEEFPMPAGRLETRVLGLPEGTPSPLQLSLAALGFLILALLWRRHSR